MPLKSTDRILCRLAEIVEYALVLLASTSVVGFSITTYSAYTSSIAVATSRANYSSYLTLAYAAIERGNASATLTLDHTSLTCDAGRLGFGSKSLSAESILPVGCHFAYENLTGLRELTFVYSNGSLDLEMR